MLIERSGAAGPQGGVRKSVEDGVAARPASGVPADASDLGRRLHGTRGMELGPPLSPLAGSEVLRGEARWGALHLPWSTCAPSDPAARRGAGLRILWGGFDSPFGRMVVTGTEAGICGLAFCTREGEAAALADLGARWPLASLQADAGVLRPWVEVAVRGEGRVPLLLLGSPLQLDTWRALLEIPPGRVASYTQVARRAGRPHAIRAVATAIGRNPISWLVPCHRALRKSGALGGYHWGLAVKRALLAHEAEAGAESGDPPVA